MKQSIDYCVATLDPDRLGAIIEPHRNRELAELAVRATGIGNVEDKVRKNHRKTLGLMRDLQSARTVGVIAEYPERGGVEIANQYEWGGDNSNGTWGFTASRPTWASTSPSTLSSR